MNVDIGAKRPIEGNQVFIVGRCFLPSEPSFVLLYDSVKGKEYKRNIKNIAPEALVSTLGGAAVFKLVKAPMWGSVWFRKSKIRRIIEMPSSHLLHSSTAQCGAIVLFDHEPEISTESVAPHMGFSLFGLKADEARQLLEHQD